jgi:capsular polysaccharide transport system permease protein
VFGIPVLTIWSLVRAPYEHGIPVTAFVWSGYLPLLVFRHVTAGALSTVRGATSLLYHRRITPFDLFVGQQGLDALGAVASAVFSFAVFYLIGWLELPYDYNLLLLGFCYNAWWSLCIGLLVAALAARSEIVAHIWQPIAYLYMFFSGFFFMAGWLPLKLRHLTLAIDPPVHCYEMIRGGLYGNRVQTFYNIGYLTFLLLILTFLGLWLLHNSRKHLELE